MLSTLQLQELLLDDVLEFSNFDILRLHQLPCMVAFGQHLLCLFGLDHVLLHHQVVLTLGLFQLCDLMSQSNLEVGYLVSQSFVLLIGFNHFVATNLLLDFLLDLDFLFFSVCLILFFDLKSELLDLVLLLECLVVEILDGLVTSNDLLMLVCDDKVILFNFILESLDLMLAVGCSLLMLFYLQLALLELLLGLY